MQSVADILPSIADPDKRDRIVFALSLAAKAFAAQLGETGIVAAKRYDIGATSIFTLLVTLLEWQCSC